MKLKEYLPALKPGLTLAAINIVLCLLFAAGAAVAIAVTAALDRAWHLPAPLMPLVVLGAIPVSVIAWIVFGLRAHRQSRPVRWAIAAIGTAPLTGLVAIAASGAVWLISLPDTPQTPTVASVMIALAAAVAAAVCGTCVLTARTRSREEKTEA